MSDCSYLDESEFAAQISVEKNFSIMSFNIQSLPSKYNESKAVISLLQQSHKEPDILR
jgi:hypothetical protein